MPWDSQKLQQIREHPHLLGHLLGKDKLTELHSYWIRSVWEAPHHAGLQAHRGSYKTTAITEIGSIWWLLYHPDDRIALIRKPYTDAARTLKTIARYMQTPVLKSLFHFAHGAEPIATVDRDNSLLYSFKTTITKENSIDAFGVDGSITGNHYDKILCDDIVVLKDRLSRAERIKTDGFFYELITNVVDPGKQVMVVGTPWHAQDTWRLVPEIQEKWTVRDTGLLSEDEIEEKRSLTTPSLFSANYELEHLSDEAQLFSDPVLGAWDRSVKGVYAQLDCAFGGGHHTALSLMAELPDGRRQVTGWAWLGNVKDYIRQVKQICRRYGVLSLYIETNPDKGYTADQLERGEGAIKCSRYAESMNKHHKIATHLLGAWGKLVFDTRNDEAGEEYLSQILDYTEKQEPDDAPDSLASLIRARTKTAGNLNQW